MSNLTEGVSRRNFMLGSAIAVSTSKGAETMLSSDYNATVTAGFPYLIDEENGPHKIAVSSWLNVSHLGLMLCDFQKFCVLEKFGFVNEYNRVRWRDVVLPNTLKLVERFRASGRPIIYTVLGSRHPQLLDIPGIARKVLALELRMTDGTPYHLHVDEEATQVVDELAPQPHDIYIVKTSSGAFASSDMDNILRNNGISSLVCTGGISELCLSSTVRAAYDRGYLCTVAEDATITGSEERQYWAMNFLNSAYAWVTHTDEILRYIE